MKKFDDLKRLFSEGRISRRDFIKSSTALGLAAAIPTALLTEEAKASEPKRGGRLIQALRGGATSDSLDGALLIDTHNANAENVNSLKKKIAPVLRKKLLSGETP